MALATVNIDKIIKVTSALSSVFMTNYTIHGFPLQNGSFLNLIWLFCYLC